jgi:hypothetical protein
MPIAIADHVWRPVHGCPIASRQHAWIHGVPSSTCSCIGISFITAVEGHYRMFDTVVAASFRLTEEIRGWFCISIRFTWHDLLLTTLWTRFERVKMPYRKGSSRKDKVRIHVIQWQCCCCSTGLPALVPFDSLPTYPTVCVGRSSQTPPDTRSITTP